MGEAMDKTPAQLTQEIHEATRDFSSSLRHLAEEAGQRLTEGQGDDALKKAFRYATYILGFIETQKPS